PARSARSSAPRSPGPSSTTGPLASQVPVVLAVPRRLAAAAAPELRPARLAWVPPPGWLVDLIACVLRPCCPLPPPGSADLTSSSTIVARATDNQAVSSNFYSISWGKFREGMPKQDLRPTGDRDERPNLVALHVDELAQLVIDRD